MIFNVVILPIILAGLMNGSFVVPLQYIKRLPQEKIWFWHSIIGLSIIPWIILIFLLPDAFYYYTMLKSGALLFLIFSGILFGLGQICFAKAISFIGIALSFTINLGIGVTIGSMFVVFYQNGFFNSQSYLVTLAVLFIVCGLIISYHAGKGDQTSRNHLETYRIGCLLAFLTGITSGLNNITFVIIAFHSQTQIQLNNSFWVWPPFLLAAAIPMALGFLYQFRKQKKVNDANKNQNYLSYKELLLIILMGLLFTGSLAIYSYGMTILPYAQQAIGWPMLMVSIIMTSQTWGWIFKENKGHIGHKTFLKLSSILLLVVAIILLSIKL